MNWDRAVRNKISILSKVRGTSFEGANSVAKFSTVISSDVGFATYISSYSKLFNCKIGRYCSIGQKVQVVFGNHPTSGFVSTHPLFYSKATATGFSFVDKNRFEEFTYTDKDKKYFVEVGNDVWVGYNVLIMAGVHIRDGAIIAAGAVVTKDVPPYAVVGGVPAKIIKYRYREEDINYLLKLQWWGKELKWINSYSVSFDNLEKLKERLKNE